MLSQTILAALLSVATTNAAPASTSDSIIGAPPGTTKQTVTDHGFIHEVYYGNMTGNSINKRNSDYVSSCGSNWTPVRDFTSGGRQYIGYASAVTAFCQHITSDVDGNPTVIGPGAYTGDTISSDASGNQVGLDGGKTPSQNGFPGHIEFEIHNKQSTGDHTPDLTNCVFYLMQMANSNANGDNCYGKGNDDTQGGTWQIGSDQISYHALPAKN